MLLNKQLYKNYALNFYLSGYMIIKSLFLAIEDKQRNRYRQRDNVKDLNRRRNKDSKRDRLKHDIKKKVEKDAERKTERQTLYTQEGRRKEKRGKG